MDFETVAANGKAAGAIHHRWALGDGHALVIGRWPDAATFQAFFEAQALIPELMAAVGIQGVPEVQILDAADAPDQF